MQTCINHTNETHTRRTEVPEGCVGETSSYTIARGEQIDHPGLSHKKLQNKVENAIARMHT